ncbi:MAG: SGNH/GDSL hydrolase family protein [Lacunisphaera sp.]|nr:SGNH/GDSL hydrolase family protein [Lacunisphaera sp.]
MNSTLLPRRLLLGVLAILLAATPAFATPDKWTADIDKFTAADATNPPPQGAVVFVGSSSIRYWTTLAEDFPGIATINRGFGGSEMADSAFYVDRIVSPYHPRLVVVYAGENDIAAGKSAASVLADFQAFRRQVHAALPATKIIYLAMKESPVRATVRPQVREGNRLIAAACATDQRCTFVDVAAPLLDAKGGYRPELFREDQLHLRPAGYAIWTKVLAPYLQP